MRYTFVLGAVTGQLLERHRRRQDEADRQRALDALFRQERAANREPDTRPPIPTDAESRLSADGFCAGCDALLESEDDDHWAPDPLGGSAGFSADHFPSSPTTSENRRCCVSTDRPPIGLAFESLTTPAPSRHRAADSSSLRRAAPWTWAAICALLAALFLFKGLLPTGTAESPFPPGVHSVSARSAPELVTIPIEQIRVGQRVPGLNPEPDSGQRIEPEPDPATWRRLELRAPTTDGTWADVVLLRSLSWLREQEAEVGDQVWMSVPECGIDGHATVLAIGPCAPIPLGPGRVVTGTFRHASAQVLDLHVEGIDESIGATANHPFWSEDRQEFVRADELEIGERLRTLHGTARLVAAVPRAATEPVYNLEVQTEHVYHVANTGILVHNGAPCPLSKFESTEKTKTIIYRVKDGKRTVYVGQVQKSKGMAARLKEHQAKKKGWAKYRIQKVEEGNWTPFEAHAHEMKAISDHGGMGKLDNIKRPITPRKFDKYRELHEDYPENPFE